MNKDSTIDIGSQGCRSPWKIFSYVRKNYSIPISSAVQKNVRWLNQLKEPPMETVIEQEPSISLLVGMAVSPLVRSVHLS